MDQKTIIKWALIAAAAYVVYRYVLKDGLLDKLLGTEVAPTPQPITPGPQPIAPAQPVTAQPTQPAQPAQPPAQPTIAQTPEERTIAAAANGNGAALLAVRTARVVFNSDQWNYYRAAGGGDVPNVDLFPSGNRDYQMTIDEYLQARAAHGLTGLGGGLGRGFLDLSRMVAVNPWIT